MLTGVRENGEPKLRAVDDFTRSQVNACTCATEKLKCDTIDCFYESLRALALQLKARYFYLYSQAGHGPR